MGPPPTTQSIQIPLTFDPNAFYQITSANRTGTLNPDHIPNLNAKNTNTVLTHTSPANSLTLAPRQTSSPADNSQLWFFRFENISKPTGQVWTIHSNTTRFGSCLERAADGALKMAPVVKDKKEQQWFVTTVETGDGKWSIQTPAGEFGLDGRPVDLALDVNKAANQVLALAPNTPRGPDKDATREGTLWEIRYVKPNI